MSAFPAPIARADPLRRAAYRVLLVASLAIWLLPIAGIALISALGAATIERGEIWTWPSGAEAVANYATVLRETGMARSVLNSFAIAIPATAATVILSALAGFALARHRVRGATFVLALFIAGNLVPFQILMIPVRELMIGTIGLYDTRAGLVLFHAAFQTGFATMLLRNFFRQLPDSLFDAARLDGWGEQRIFVHIALPLVRPALAAVAALVFTFVWNDFFWALVLVHSESVRPATAALQSLRGMYVVSWHLIAAGCILAALPPVALFLMMQRHFIAGLTAGTASE